MERQPKNGYFSLLVRAGRKPLRELAEIAAVGGAGFFPQAIFQPDGIQETLDEALVLIPDALFTFAADHPCNPCRKTGSRNAKRAAEAAPSRKRSWVSTTRRSCA